MHNPPRRARVPAASLLLLAALAWSGGALAGAPATSPHSIRVWSAPDLIALTREAPGPESPPLELHRRPLESSAPQPLCQTSVFQQGGAQDCFVPYQDCSLTLQVSRSGGALTLNVRKVEGPDCPSDLPASWRLASTRDVVRQLVRTDFITWVRSLDPRMQVGDPGHWRSAAELLRPLSDADLLRLFDAIAPFLAVRIPPSHPREALGQFSHVAASLIDKCKTVDAAECIHGYLQTTYSKPKNAGGKTRDLTPEELGDPSPVPASKLAVPKGLTPPGLAGVWTRPEIHLGYVRTVSARVESGQLHLTFLTQDLGSSGGLREQPSFPSIDCSGPYVSQGWSRLACGDTGAVKVKLQGSRLVVRPLDPQWASINEPRLSSEEDYFRVDPLALQAAFLLHPVDGIGGNQYPQDLDADLKSSLVDRLEKDIPQKVRAFLRERKETPETLSAARAYDLLALTVTSLMTRCPAQDPERNACIERALPEAIGEAHRTVR